ncbi:16S rRNA (uracil(1498)-N(3))-methyltransferase [Helcobacillus massiliensis]|uniref:16S rRNA (uracil(1498)-N(3))-methyltransferase n=1 Tax=Helcobacillus massiliensis TaxID=521392 RepID=UPI0021A9427E|nr:16S rRNA (uracil(1498)-N(3))-methyltransferase [Helcobacillus massiliensis]MCT1557164.1 16S rRNA (uracil(1498)-N(3))-methyltransferase [Helcobacillus massiliensis]MCT2036101.1 16S rRNA (uracil(1498)-N(3))-methyltransferase [Helcobacillus massiliensis]MCT2331232.1 16S rRNA (uracil(1498)-N(3))-methyltransferase [Helcobacillus massiliensis]MDK7741233.1 16S rRNA (uracil(1498)-N(3))-methyltransferase [Helcobacillus massiliensis]WOO94038.1 16S rRNA (uracil(1498)-N(3))-methyltransferase [Helcobaci
MTALSFLLPDGALEGHRAGDSITVDGDEGRHGAAVVRLRAGEDVLLTDPVGRQAAARVTATTKTRFTAELTAEPADAPAPRPRITLVQALAKGGRDESAVESSVELGADAVLAWQAGRSIVRWQGAKKVKGVAKWEATVRNAVKQSRRPILPRVEGVVTTAELAERIREGEADGCRAIVLHEAEQRPLTTITDALADARDILIVVGPEGGISSEELDQLQAAGALSCVLGTSVLRASTAGPAAIAVLSAALGRW